MSDAPKAWPSLDRSSENWDEQKWDKEFEQWKEFHTILFQMTNKDKKKEIDQLFEAWRGVFATFQCPPSEEELRVASLEMILDVNLEIPWHRHLGFICAHVKWQRSPDVKKMAKIAQEEGKTFAQVTIEHISEMRKKVFNRV